MAKTSGGAVAITGGAGFVGLHIAEAFAGAGWTVLSLHRSPLDDIAQAVAARWSDRITFVPCNVRSEHELRTVIGARELDAVVHAAAITSAGPSDTVAMVDVQVRATQVLLDLAREGQVRRVIVLSSAGVLRSPETLDPLDEEYPVSPSNPYAITKIAAEQLVVFSKATVGVDAIAVRLPFVYGEYERPTASRTRMSSICLAVQLARAEATIRVNGPAVLRDWTHADDIASGIVTFASHGGTLRPVYHLGIGLSYSMLETMRTIGQLVPDASIVWVPDERDANVPISETNRRAALAIDRAGADIDFVPRINLAEGVRRYSKLT